MKTSGAGLCAGQKLTENAEKHPYLHCFRPSEILSFTELSINISLRYIVDSLNFRGNHCCCKQYSRLFAKIYFINLSTGQQCNFSRPEQKVSYLRYWIGDQGIPLVKKFTALGKLSIASNVAILTRSGSLPLLIAASISACQSQYEILLSLSVSLNREKKSFLPCG